MTWNPTWMRCSNLDFGSYLDDFGILTPTDHVFHHGFSRCRKSECHVVIGPSFLPIMVGGTSAILPTHLDQLSDALQ